MPTGYTAAIEEGCSFEEYVWGCARAFGACITMRDAPAGEPIPDAFQPGGYHAEAIADAEKEIERLAKMTPDEVNAEMEAEREEAVRQNEKYALENEEKKARYAAILAKVRAWEPPSPDHVEMKKFMLQQIEISLPGEPCQTPLPPEDADAWLAEQRAKAERALAYHREEHAKDLERTRGRNEWVRKLRLSVPQPVTRIESDAA